MGARTRSAGHYNKMIGKAKVKRLGFIGGFLFLLLAILSFFPVGVVTAQDAAGTEKKAEQAASKSELDKLKTEWEAVREQQIQMIREKEDQLEKLKEEIFARMKGSSVPVTPQPDVSRPQPLVAPVSVPPAGNSSTEFEAQKAALQAERQKFFAEMSRQKESLRQLQSALDKKAKQLEADRARFEQEKKTAAR